MSNYEAEWGTFKLPSADFTKMRKAFETAERQNQEKTFNETQLFWKSLSRGEQTDRDKYDQARRAFIEEVRGRGSKLLSSGNYQVSSVDSANDRLAEDVDSMLYRADGGTWGTNPPRRVQKSEVEWANNRTTQFSDSSADVYFDRDSSTVHWQIDENNHAVEYGHEGRLSRLFDDELTKVRWTKDTGGVMNYRGEYENGDRETRGIGPLGHDLAPDVAEDFTDSRGNRVSGEETRQRHHDAKMAAAIAYRDAMNASSGQQGRVGRGVPAGGQFSTRSHGADQIGSL